MTYEIKEEIKFRVNKEDLEHFKRLDSFLISLTKELELSRNYIQQLFKKGLISSECSLSLSKMPPEDTEITLKLPKPLESELIPQNIPLDILFEDSYLLILNKPAGLVVHPAPGHNQGTLVNALLHYCKDLQGIGDIKRPGIVHRLDKGTSGVMVVAKEQKTHEALSLIFQKHDLIRRYEAISFRGPVLNAGKIESFISRHPRNRKKMTSKISSGKNAITFFKVIERFQKFNHVELTLETGRTHQIRVHLSEKVQAPILNDQTYAKVSQQIQSRPFLKDIIQEYEHPFLHAKELSFTHPMTGEPLHYKSETPKIFQQVLQELRNDS